jgi:DNA replication protein DnaC
MSGKDPSVLLLEHHLKALKLPTILREYAGVAAVCSQEHSSFAQYLLRLVERELIDRERRATERRIKEAAFPVIKTIESFDFKVQPSINQPLVRELLQGDYIAKKENVLLVGNAGTGKTHLATALGFAACSQGKRVRFYTTTGLVTQLLEAREERTVQRLHKQLDRLDLILLDELGYVPFSKAGAELLFDVVSRAYERTSLVVTTNLPFEQWTEVLGSERLTGALLDRLTHRVHILEAQRHQLSLAGRQEAPQTLVSARSRRPKTIRPPGGASWGLAARPPARFSSQSNTLWLSNLTTYHETSLLPPGAALLDRHPPHFSTAVYSQTGDNLSYQLGFLHCAAMYRAGILNQSSGQGPTDCRLSTALGTEPVRCGR